MQTKKSHTAYFLKGFGLLLVLFLPLVLHSQTTSESKSEQFRKKAKENYQKAQLDSSIYFYKKAISTAKTENDQYRLFILYNDISLSYYALAQREAMLMYNDSAMQFSGIPEVTLEERVSVVMNRAHVYSFLGEEQQTITIYEELLESVKASNSHKTKSFINMNLAKTYGNMSTTDSTYYPKAVAYAEDALRFAFKENDSLLIGRSKVYLGTLYTLHPSRKQKETGVQYILEAKEIFDREKDLKNYYFSVAQLATAYIVLKQYDSVIALFHSEKEKMQNSSNASDWMHILRHTQSAYQKLNQWEEAYSIQNRFYAIKDSLDNQKLKSTLAELEAKYQNREKAIQLEAMKLEKQMADKRNQLLLVSIASISVISILLIFSLRDRLQTQKKLAEQKEKVTREEIKRRKIEEEKVKNELDLKTRKLVSGAMAISERNEMLITIANDLKALEANAEKNNIRKIQRKIHHNLNPEVHWSEFSKIFEEIHPDFGQKLKKDYPDLTEKEIRLLSFIRLGLNIKETANILHLEPNSVKTARYRLKKKLLSDNNETLENFVNTY